jgi:tetratricopeptide (TPR) repeat protein
MADLLAALQRAAASRVRAAALPVVGLGLATVAGFAWLGSADDPSACAGLDAELDGAWDAERRLAVTAAFTRSERPWADDVGTTAVARLDAHAHRWLEARRALCEQSITADAGSAYALRRVCLDANRAALVTATDLLLHNDDDALQHAIEIVEGIGAVEDCLDVEARTPRKTVPSEAALPEIAAIQAELASLAVLRAAGRYGDALQRAEPLATRATEVDDLHDATLAMLEVADLRGRLERDDADAGLHAALSLAMSTGRDDVAAKVAALLAWRHADATELDQARWWLDHADAAAQAAGEDPRLAAYVENARSHVLGVAGDHTAESEAARRALAAIEASDGPDSEHMAVVSNTLAVSLYRRGEHEEAATHAERALRIVEDLLGPRHPRWSSFALTLAGIRISQARHAEAASLLDRAHAVAKDSLGPSHSNTLTIASGLAMARAYEGDHEDAARLHREVLEARLASEGPQAMGVATSRINLGIALHRIGRLEESEQQLDDARAVLTETLPPDHPRVSYVRAVLADVRVDLGQAEAVAPELQSLLEAGQGDPSDVAIVRFALARARWELQPGSPEALDLARQAREAYAATPGFTTAVERIDHWLSSRS